MAEIDPLKDGFYVSSYWGPRVETPAQIAARCRALLEKLLAISPVFANWTYTGRKNPPPKRRYEGADAVGDYFRDQYRTIELRQAPDIDLASLVEAGVAREDDGAPSLIYGYRFSVFTGSRRDPKTVSLRVHAGCWSQGKFYTNGVNITTRPLCDENETFLTLAVLRTAMLAIVETFDTTWASVYPADLIELWEPAYVKRRPTFQLAWITYLSPRLASLVAPPRGAFNEYTPERGLVMTATKDRFDTHNELHLAAARRIEAALGPVNALPWPPDAPHVRGSR